MLLRRFPGLLLPKKEDFAKILKTFHPPLPGFLFSKKGGLAKILTSLLPPLVLAKNGA
jgi:hypothetical protein